MPRHTFAHGNGESEERDETKVRRDRRREAKEREYASDKWSRDDFFRDLGRASRPAEKPPRETE